MRTEIKVFFKEFFWIEKPFIIYTLAHLKKNIKTPLKFVTKRLLIFPEINHSMSGSLFSSPIIIKLQVDILSTGLVQKRAVEITDEQGNDSIAIHLMVYLSFVFDHRVLDGEGADNFLRKVKDTLENWNCV
jgi:pyruvate/2-oxoglutarate dehydrogenase complex dihydrolipoamide acyltransferase (E2) component